MRQLMLVPRKQTAPARSPRQLMIPWGTTALALLNVLDRQKAIAAIANLFLEAADVVAGEDEDVES